MEVEDLNRNDGEEIEDEHATVAEEEVMTRFPSFRFCDGRLYLKSLR